MPWQNFLIEVRSLGKSSREKNPYLHEYLNFLTTQYKTERRLQAQNQINPSTPFDRTLTCDKQTQTDRHRAMGKNARHKTVVSFLNNNICVNSYPNQIMNTEVIASKSRHFYSAMLCICGTSHGPVSVSVCLPQVGVLLKRLNVGSHKQHHTIAQGL